MFIFLLITSILYILSTVAVEIDWEQVSALHTDFGLAKSSSLLPLLKSIPISLYWDSNKATFRTNLIGELLAQDQEDGLYGSYLSSKVSKVVSNGELVTANLTVVDLNRLFMEAIVVIQALAHEMEEMKRQLGGYYHHRAEGRLLQVEGLLKATENREAPICLTTLSDQLAMKLQDVQRRVDAFEEDLAVELEKLAHEAERRKKVVQRESENMMNMTLIRRSNLYRLKRENEENLLAKEEKALLLEREHSLTALFAEHSFALQGVKAEAEQRVKTALFRVAEEARQARANEPLLARLQQLDFAFRMEGVRSMVEVFFRETRSLFQQLAAEPQRLMAMVAACLLLILTATVLLEAIQVKYI